MKILALVAPYLKKFKYFAICLLVGVLTYMICMRWRSALGISSPWPYVGGAVLFTLIVVLLVIFIQKRREKRMAAALEAGIAQADEEKVDLRGEIKALRENWTKSLESLKESRLMADGGATLFRMPWYVIIGEPASGKSTLLRKSGLDFPVGDASVSGLHGTRNCDWWFANEAIFLDTAGRYIIETQEAEWVAFLGLLKKYRKKKPINGVLVAIAANSLLTKSRDELLQDGKRIRARIDELIDLLGVNFPVYILVTKCDLVGGFVEFFGPLDDHDTAQMVGFTNPADPEFKLDAEAYEAGFGGVRDRIFRMRPWLESQTKRRDLMKAFLFPEEFEYLSRPLKDVLDVVFRPNVYQETPVCRGVYFSSGTQVGSPLAKALDDMARDLNIPSDFGFGLGMEEEKEVRTYFIRDLVGEQILKDKEMIWRTWRDELRVKKRRTGWGIVGVSVAALLAIFTLNAFFSNRGRLDDFQVGIEGKRPLDVAKGCIETRRMAGDASVLDLGLNQSDELKPSIDRAFQNLFSKGCLETMIAGVRAPVFAGIPKAEDGNPDVPAYVSEYGNYLYLRRGLAGELPEEPDLPKEEPHLKFLHQLLLAKDATGGATPEDLRTVLVEYGKVAGFEDFPEHRRKEIEDEYLKNVSAFVASVQKWLAQNQTAAGELRGNLDDAIAGLESACESHREQIVPHETPDTIVEYAKHIRRAASPMLGGGAGTTPINTLAAGVSEPGDLRDILVQVKGSVPPDSGLAGDIDTILGSIGQPATTAEMKDKELARQGLIGFLDRVIETGESPVSYDGSPTHSTLQGNREEIAAEIQAEGEKAWKEIRPRVEVIEGGPIEEKNEAGETVRKEGWWDTLVLLRRARIADVRKAEYLEKGLMPWFDGERWLKERSADRDYETYTLARLNELILPRIHDQEAFFGDEILARSIRDEARTVDVRAAVRFLGEMETYWLARVRGAIPKTPAQTVSEAYDQLRLWTESRGEFLRTCEDVQASLYDLTKVEAPEDDPIANETFDERRRIFEVFVVCFDAEDPEVRRHMTVSAAAEEFGALMRAMEPLAGGFGGGDRAAARKLAAQVLAGGGRASPFAKAMTAVRDFRKEASTSPPAGQLADWMEKVVTNAWNGIVVLTAEDINAEWERRRAEWVRGLSAGSPAGFRRVFGERGEFSTFARDYLEPFFDIPGYRPKATEGAVLEVTPEFASFVGRISTLGSGLMDDGGAIRSESIHMDLGLGGTSRPHGLKIEYVSSAGAKTSREFRNAGAVSFDLDWTPTECRSLRFIVDLGGGRTHEFKWEGMWAVAHAFFVAERVGSRFTWRAEDPSAGTIEVWLDITGATRLIDLYRSAGGRSPIDVSGTMPTQAVKVRK